MAVLDTPYNLGFDHAQDIEETGRASGDSVFELAQLRLGPHQRTATSSIAPGSCVGHRTPSEATKRRASDALSGTSGKARRRF